MDAVTARSLVEHINRNNTHIFAYTMDFGERTWVVLHDAAAPRTAPCEEPILEVADYLERLRRRAPACAELRALIEEWLEARVRPAGDGAAIARTAAVPSDLAQSTLSHTASALAAS
jgi:hypothetical protein